MKRIKSGKEKVLSKRTSRRGSKELSNVSVSDGLEVTLDLGKITSTQYLRPGQTVTLITGEYEVSATCSRVLRQCL